MPMWLDEFSGDEFPLEIGSLYGVRYWSVGFHSMRSREISLAGARKNWSPGENRAVCLNEYAVLETIPEMLGKLYEQRNPGSVMGGPVSPQYQTTEQYRAHTFDEIPSKKCHCGYWAYWAPNDASPPGLSMPSVMGVIEGWGNYRTGPKGFRCNTARIAALHVMEQPPGLLGGGGVEDWRTRVEEDLAARFRVTVYSDSATMLKAYPTSRTPPPPGPPKPKLRRIGRAWRDATLTTWQMPATQPLCAACHGPATTAVLRATAAGPVWVCSSCAAPAQPCGCSKCAPYYARGGIVGSSISSRVPLDPRDALKQLNERKRKWGLS